MRKGKPHGRANEEGAIDSATPGRGGGSHPRPAMGETVSEEEDAGRSAELRESRAARAPKREGRLLLKKGRPSDAVKRASGSKRVLLSSRWRCRTTGAKNVLAEEEAKEFRP